MQKHAYLILAHSNFSQLRKLVELLDDPRNDIFIHIDGRARFRAAEWDGICRHSNLKFTKKRNRVHWGGVSIIKSEMELLKESTSAGKYGHYHLLSGMDLPIKPQDAIHDFFGKHENVEFINYWNLKDDTETRFRYYTMFPEGNRNFITKFINKTVRKLQKRMGWQMNRGIEFKYGSQWFSITDGLARYIVSQEDWILRTFRFSYLCDEVFVATLAWNSPYRGNIYFRKTADSSEVNDSNMRFIDWNSSKDIRHPWTFRSSDFDRLMAVPHFWARKFDEKVDNQIIERIYCKLKTER